MKETIETKRYIKNHQAEGHFCDTCGKPVTHSVTDARQVGNEWTQDSMRNGCTEHRVEPMIHFADGTSMPAKQYEVKQ
jgi:hypothetical protein